MNDTTHTAPETPSAAATAPGDGRRNIEAILPLLPNQKALLLHRDGPAGDPGFLQVRFTLHGPLDIPRFERAWNTAVAWHQALRSSIRSRTGGDPMAVVWRRVHLRIAYEDWRGTPNEEGRLAAFLESDRSRGLDLETAPVMRAALFRLGDRRHEMVWTCHHILVDGWSAAIVLDDVLALYRSFGSSALPDPSPPPPDGLRKYVTWVLQRDSEPAERYWRKRLAGYEGAPRLVLGDVDEENPASGEMVVPLSVALSDQIRDIAAKQRLTINAFVQGAWALVLGHLLDTSDVVFGTTVAGRSADVAGIERLVGYFSNGVPVRVRLDGDLTVSEWLERLRNEQFEMEPYSAASLADVQSWSPVPGHRALFESFLVVESFPTQAGIESVPDDVTLTGFRSGLTSVFPLTVALALGDPWFVAVKFDSTRCSADAAGHIVAEFIATLQRIVDQPDRRVADVKSLVGAGLPSAVVSSAPGSAAAVLRSVSQDPPRSWTELEVARLWEQLLDLQAVGSDDDYFALGGTSIGAVRLFAEIHDRFGALLPVTTLLRHSTVAGLAAAIDETRGEPGAPWDCLVPMQTSGDGTPIALIHGGSGIVLFFRALGELLGAEQPVFALQAVGLDGRTPPLESVPAMAARYIAELKTVHPHGPYRLVGYCFGGNVGLEMAHQLEALGDEIEVLVVIDAGLPLDAARATTSLGRALAVLRTRGLRGLVAAGANKVRHRKNVLWDGSVDDGELGQARLAVSKASRVAFARFQPKATSAPIIHVRSLVPRTGEGKDYHGDWGMYTPQLSIVDIDAQHQALFEAPAVNEIAEIIQSRTAT